MRVVAVIIGTLVGVGVVLLGLLMAGMRWQVGPVVNTVRRMNRSVTNPRVMRTAGTAGTQTSVIEHVGRNSGRTYETPVDVIETTTRLLIALPYGARTDWLRNVLASGSAAVITGGERIEVGESRHRRDGRCGGHDSGAHDADTATVRGESVPESREVVNLVNRVHLQDPANPPSRKAPLVWALSALIPWAVLALAQLVWFVIDHRTWWLHAVAAAVTAVGALVFVVVVPLWRFRVHRWDVSPDAVYTRSGWLVQERRIAPISRVQTVDTERGPLDRLFGLANVTVTTASSAGAVRIVALDSDVADRVVAQLTDIAAIGGEDAT